MLCSSELLQKCCKALCGTVPSSTTAGLTLAPADGAVGKSYLHAGKSTIGGKGGQEWSMQIRLGKGEEN